MTPDEIAPLFTRADGNYLFARWGRPIAPVVFGVTEQTLAVVKGACEAVVALAGHRMAETDPELVDFEMDVYWVTAGGEDPVARLQLLLPPARRRPAYYRNIKFVSYISE